MTWLSIINGILLMSSMLSLWIFYHRLGYCVGYIECYNPESFPLKELLITLALSASYFIFSAIAANAGLVGFSAQAFMFISYASTLFLLNAIVSLIMYIPSYKIVNMVISLIFATPFLAGAILMRMFNIA